MRLALLLTLTSGCYVSYYAQTGDAALESGDYSRAVANLQAAVNNTDENTPEHEEYRGRLDEAARAWARHEMAAARKLDELDRARERVWTLVDTPWVPSDARAEALALAAELTEASWEEAVLAHAERHFTVNAVQTARALTLRFPASHPIRARRAEVEERAAAFHTERARQLGNHPYARRLHRCLADWAAGESHCASESPPAYGPVSWRIEPVEGHCAWVGERLSRRLGSANGDAVAVTLTVSQCPQHEKRWTEQETYTYLDQEPYVAEIDEPTLITGACPEPECTRRDPLGTCVAWVEQQTCEEPEPTWTTRKRKVRRYRQVERDGVRAIHYARFSTRVQGSARFLWDGETVTLPIAVEVSQLDRAFWSPQQQVRFGGASVESATTEAMQRVSKLLRNFREQRLKRRGAALVEQGQRAAEAGDHAAAEDHFFESVCALDEVMTPATEYFHRRYGLYRATLVEAANGRVPKSPTRRSRAASMTKPSAEARALERELSPVRVEDRDIWPMFAVGLELAASAEQSPLDDTGLATGVVATMRAGESGNLWFRWRLDTPNLGGDARGFGVAMRGGEQLGGGLAFLGGLAYREQRNDRGERFSLATIPLTLYWNPLSWLVLDLDVRLNLIKIRDWTGGEPNDPDYGSPLSVGLTLQSRRVFLRAHGTTWVGVDTTQAFYAGGLVGVRL